MLFHEFSFVFIVLWYSAPLGCLDQTMAFHHLIDKRCQRSLVCFVMSLNVGEFFSGVSALIFPTVIYSLGFKHLYSPLPATSSGNLCPNPPPPRAFGLGSQASCHYLWASDGESCHLSKHWRPWEGRRTDTSISFQFPGINSGRDYRMACGGLCHVPGLFLLIIIPITCFSCLSTTCCLSTWDSFGLLVSLSARFLLLT